MDCITVFDVVQSPFVSSPVNFAKSWSLEKSLNKVLYWKYLVLEITSKKICLIFFLLGTIPQSSSYFFLKNFLIILLLQSLNEVSQSNIFFVFFYIWSFKVNSIFIIIWICFLLSKLNINWFSFFLIIFLQYIALIFD